MLAAALPAVPLLDQRRLVPLEVFDAPHVSRIPLNSSVPRITAVAFLARHTSRIGTCPPYLHTFLWPLSPQTVYQRLQIGGHVPLEGQRIVRIIIEECSSLPEHYPGYRKDLLDLVTDILALERQRAWQNIAIQKKTLDAFDAAAEHFLHKSKATGSASGESQ